MSEVLRFVKNDSAGFIFNVTLFAQSDGAVQTTPTLASGDVKISTDGGSLTNLNTLPSEAPAGSGVVKVTLSQAETNADYGTIVFKDAAGAEWQELHVHFATVPAPANVTEVNDDATAATRLADYWGNIRSGTVDSSSGWWVFADAERTEADRRLVGSEVVWTGGSNAGLSQMVYSFDAGTDETYVLPNLGTISAGDTYLLMPAKADMHGLRTSKDVGNNGAVMDNFEDFFDGTGYAGGTTKLQVNTTQIEGADATDQIRDAVVDDATRIDASALNTAAAAVGSDGAGLTEAGGTGDHLTALATQASVDTIAGYVDTEVAAIKAVTDQMVFGVANTLNVNITYVNEVEVAGNGDTTKWGPA